MVVCSQNLWFQFGYYDKTVLCSDETVPVCRRNAVPTFSFSFAPQRSVAAERSRGDITISQSHDR